MDKKWHYTEKGEYPVISGEYENDDYPQIPCIVQEGNRIYSIKYWNCTEECWDDEEGDDYYCAKDGISQWKYLDPILMED